MICPACGYENLAGADRCEDCMQALAKLDIPQPTVGLQQKIMEDPVSVLNPVPPITLPEEAPVSEALRLMKHHKVGCILALKDGKLEGIFSERDLLCKLAGTDLSLEQTRLRDVMTPHPVTLTADDSIRFALFQMSIGGFRHIPILKDGNLCGIISIKDVLRYLSQAIRSTGSGNKSKLATRH